MARPRDELVLIEPLMDEWCHALKGRLGVVIVHLVEVEVARAFAVDLVRA